MLAAAVSQQEKLANLTRADSEMTVATVETFVSETSVNTDIAGATDRPCDDKTNNNAQELLQRGFLNEFYHKNIGTIIIIGSTRSIK